MKKENWTILTNKEINASIQKPTITETIRLNRLLISSFRRVQNIVCFLLGNSPASDIYMPTFRNTLSVPSS